MVKDLIIRLLLCFIFLKICWLEFKNKRMKNNLGRQIIYSIYVIDSKGQGNPSS